MWVGLIFGWMYCWKKQTIQKKKNPSHWLASFPENKSNPLQTFLFSTEALTKYCQGDLEMCLSTYLPSSNVSAAALSPDYILSSSTKEDPFPLNLLPVSKILIVKAPFHFQFLLVAIPRVLQPQPTLRNRGISSCCGPMLWHCHFPNPPLLLLAKHPAQSLAGWQNAEVLHTWAVQPSPIKTNRTISLSSCPHWRH